jgi:hypothetical protein
VFVNIYAREQIEPIAYYETEDSMDISLKRHVRMALMVGSCKQKFVFLRILLSNNNYFNFIYPNPA